MECAYIAVNSTLGFTNSSLAAPFFRFAGSTAVGPLGQHVLGDRNGPRACWTQVRAGAQGYSSQLTLIGVVSAMRLLREIEKAIAGSRECCFDSRTYTILPRRTPARYPRSRISNPPWTGSSF